MSSLYIGRTLCHQKYTPSTLIELCHFRYQRVRTEFARFLTSQWCIMNTWTLGTSNPGLPSSCVTVSLIVTSPLCRLFLRKLQTNTPIFATLPDLPKLGLPGPYNCSADAISHVTQLLVSSSVYQIQSRWTS